MEDDLAMQVMPPLYLAVARTTCWKCGADMPVAALVAPNVADAPGDVLILEGIDKLPDPVVRFIQTRVPQYRLTHSKTLESEYFANNCPSCGVLTGDFFLFSEPGGAFWPETVEDAAAIELRECPLSGALVIDAGFGAGLGEFILEHATRVEQSGS